MALVLDAPLTDAVSPARNMTNFAAMLGGLVLAICALSVLVRHAERSGSLATQPADRPASSAVTALSSS